MEPAPTITILFLGDIIGKPGRRVVRRFLARLEAKPDLIVANVENAAHGFGVTEGNLQELKECGVQVFSGGNHTFDRKETFSFINREPFLLRPENYPAGTPGTGHCVITLESGIKVAVLNLLGRIFMEPLSSPYLVADELLPKLAEQADITFVDFHAEATAEKVAMGWYLDGRCSAVVGTHTHVQTADERILPNGTAYLTDAGCCGPANGVIGMDRENVFRRMIQQLPARFEVAPGPAMVNGARITINTTNARAVSIERVHYMETEEESAATD
jgi:2',3'-cyclic-nucleotide 2'-phosphodiesterase